MALQDGVTTDPHGALLNVPNGVQAGMLGLTAGGERFQPMTHSAERPSGSISFISSTADALVQSLGMGEDADYVVSSEDHDLHASLRGKLYQLHGDSKLDELWCPIVAA
jgi:general stress protein 26